MNKKSLYCRIDLEDYLVLSKKYHKNDAALRQSRVDKEYEFFIPLLERTALTTSKQYSQYYRDFITRQFDVSFQTNQNFKAAKAWGVDFNNQLTSLSSKLENIGLLNELNQHKAFVIKSKKELEEGYVYTKEFSSSGRGHYLFPKHKDKLERILETQSLKKMKKLERVKDISSSFVGGQMVHYENFVDNFFQYKGSFIGDRFEHYPWFNEYKQKLEVVKKYIQSNLWNIDSFIYDENQLYFMCDINPRMSMGQIAYGLHKMYFSKNKYLLFLLVKASKPRRIDNHSLLIAPEENFFQILVIHHDCKHTALELAHKNGAF